MPNTAHNSNGQIIFTVAGCKQYTHSDGAFAYPQMIFNALEMRRVLKDIGVTVTVPAVAMEWLKET